MRDSILNVLVRVQAEEKQNEMLSDLKQKELQRLEELQLENEIIREVSIRRLIVNEYDVRKSSWKTMNQAQMALTLV